jgi:hypothetical protein
MRHTLGDLVSPLAGAGLGLDFAHEHDVSPSRDARSSGGAARLLKAAGPLPPRPPMYSLKATRP